MKYCPKCQQQYPQSQLFCPDDGHQISLRDPYHLVGRILVDRYRIDALAGIGGMGAVYSAYHLGLDRRVALKILLPHLALGDERMIGLFEREAKMVGQLCHENIATVFDAGRTAEGIAYMAMEWLDGRTLEEELSKHGQFSLERTARLLRQISAALDSAHARRIIHRDLKPANIMLIRRPDGSEQVKLLDFGIGKVMSETAGSPVSSVMGTPHYASPEQFKLGGQIDGRADIYSLGVMLYQMLTGTLPFDAASIRELIELHLTASPPRIGKLRPDVPAAVGQLVNRMLAKEPGQRPERAGAVVESFDGVLTSLSRSQASDFAPAKKMAAAVAAQTEIISINRLSAQASKSMDSRRCSPRFSLTVKVTFRLSPFHFRLSSIATPVCVQPLPHPAARCACGAAHP